LFSKYFGMKFKINILLTLFTFLVSIQYITAQKEVQLSESTQISLLTNTPWDGAVYALYGHTALRVSDPVQQIDFVFNYGLFDFDSPNFMQRFVKGETDYSVGYTNLNRYTFEYQMRGIGITEQILNLKQDEKQKVFDALLINCLPENRVYRYNYFYDNCSTRPRDIIENNINGTIIYTPTGKDQTYRDLVHECVRSQPWVMFGIDLVIGADADKIITDRQKDFLPAYLMRAYSGANIQNQDGTTRNLVLSEHNILEQTIQSAQSNPRNTPLIVGIILLIISILISYTSYKSEKVVLGKIFDTLLFLTAGIAGSIIFFLMYFSVHPCTNPNWNLVWLNPLQLIFALLFLIKSFSKVIYIYHFINFAVLIIFLLAWFLIPQYLEIAFLPYILAIAVRSGTNILQYRKKH